MAVGVPLGPYRLVRRLATGGMAEIYLARQEGPDGFARDLVVKRILPHLAADPEFTRMFRDEAKLAALLSHPNVVHVYDFGAVREADGSTLYLAMELVRGVDLRALILRARAEARRAGRASAIPAHHAAKICSFVCEALAHAHAVRIDGRPAGIVHRDVTPSNVLLSFDGAVKLADFGIAKAATTTKDRTEHGIVKGKHTYLSPEQARGDALDARSDLFNVGILLFESILGEALFPPNDPRLARKMSARGEIPRRERFDRMPEGLARIALKALSARRDERHPDALALRADLEAFLRTCPEPSDSVEIGRFVRHVCAEELSEDALGPRAAGTMASQRQARVVAAVGTSVAGTPPRGPGGTQPLTTHGTSGPRAPPLALRDDRIALHFARLGRSSSGSGAAFPTSAGLTSGGRVLADVTTTDPAAEPSFDALDELAPPAIESGVVRHGVAPSEAPETGDADDGASSLDVEVAVSAPVPASTTPIVRTSARWHASLAGGIVVVATAAAIGLVVRRGEQAAPRASLPRTATLAVTSEPPGARLFIDGVEHGATPTTVDAIMPERTVHLELRDESGSVLDVDDVSLAPGERREIVLDATPQRGRIRVTSEPSGATVRLDGRLLGTTPLEQEVALGEHRLGVELAGYVPARDEVRIERRDERLSLSFALRALPAGLAPSAEHDHPRSSSRLLPSRTSSERRSAEREATGTLRIATTPWSEVFEGSRRLGETPLQLEMSVGRHVLILRSPERPPRTEVVDIREGEVTRVRLLL